MTRAPFGLLLVASLAAGQAPSRERVELSAPLFPNSIVFQHFGDPKKYPATSDQERKRLVDEEVRVFEQLLPACAALRPAIKLQAPGQPPLTPDQIATNYDEVARCAYERFGAKPYWIPRMIDDLDICARKMGAGWRLPTEADVAAFAETDFQFFQTTLTAQKGKDWFPTHFYYSLDVYVRGGDGALKLGNLAPMTQHVAPLPIPPDAMTALYVGNGRPIGLRCIRLTPLSP